jgi:Protein of unknown function (DUF3040)
MPLSEREQRLLDQIERALHFEDPKLASTLRGRSRHKWRRRRFVEGVAVFALGIVLLVLGVGITSLSSNSGFLWLSAIGFLLMFGGSVLVVASVGAIGKASLAEAGKPDRGRFSGRLGGRFRRRFE